MAKMIATQPPSMLRKAGMMSSDSLSPEVREIWGPLLESQVEGLANALGSFEEEVRKVPLGPDRIKQLASAGEKATAKVAEVMGRMEGSKSAIASGKHPMGKAATNSDHQSKAWTFFTHNFQRAQKEIDRLVRPV